MAGNFPKVETNIPNDKSILRVEHTHVSRLQGLN